MYEYKLLGVDRVIDGDTVIVTLDVGFHLTTRVHVRLLGVNTPERGQPGCAEATAAVVNWLTGRLSTGTIRVSTVKTDAFGRWLARIVHDGPDGQPRDLGQHLLDEGHAVVYAKR